MRICLVGDYSAFHHNLKIGLEKLGCDVVLFSTGDGWKNIPLDVLMGSGISGLSGRLVDQFWLPDFFKLKKLGRFDIVQFINPVVFPFNILYKFNSYLSNKIFLQMAIERADKSFLVAAGDDYYYTKECLTGGFRYEPLTDCIHYDKGSVIKQFFRYDWLSDTMKALNNWTVTIVNKVIPIAYEYHQSYANNGIKKLANVIPMPLDASGVDVVPLVQGRGRVIHGINKIGFKGTRHIRSAFELISYRMNDYDFVIQNPLPLHQYIKSLQYSRAVVDQVNSYSYAMNALYTLASGRIVITGAEPECLMANQVPETKFVINARPELASIVQSIEDAIEYSNDNKNYPEECRAYVETFHSPEKIAHKFMKTWIDS